VIRQVDPLFDLPTVANLEAECAEDAWTLEDYRQLWRETPGCEAFLCEIGGEPVGYLVHQPAEVGRYVTGVGVVPWFRGQGLGRKLMRRMVDSGLPLTLHVRVKNKTARALYRSLGFSKLKLEPDYYGEEDGILMIRP
jgi:[ribosomal protein S18]-alanine N-acetyltransferase